MPKGKLEFNLPEDEDAFKLAQRGADYYCRILDIKEVMRQVRKYGKSQTEALEEINQILAEAETEDIQ